jgi:hypothetical protein
MPHYEANGQERQERDEHVDGGKLRSGPHQQRDAA